MSSLETIQNYLEAIHILHLEKNYVRAIDIAEYLGFKRSTVSVALKKLLAEDYIKIEDNFISLTTKGQKEAERTYERHETLAKMFMMLGVDKDTAYHDACLIEHDLSDSTFEAIKRHYKKSIET